MTADTSDPDRNRRTVLKAVGASAAAGTVGLSGQAAGRASTRARDNADLESFRSLSEQADPAVAGLLENLSAGGFISGTSLDALEFDSVVASRGLSRDVVSVYTVSFDGEDALVFETLLPTERFDEDINVTIVPERGKAGATAVLNGERYVLSASFEEFVSVNSAAVTLADCSGCTCDVYCTQAYDDAKICEDGSGTYKKCCNCSNW